MEPTALDHVALWVADRDPLADFLCEHLGMHVIERTDDFTLVGADARRGKLTLFAAEGPREPGAARAGRAARVATSTRALAALPAGLSVDRGADGVATFEAPEGLGLGLVEVPDAEVEYDIDHVVLRVPDPAAARDGLADARACARRRRPAGGRATSACASSAGATSREGERPLLNHIALLVDSGQEQLDEARAPRASRSPRCATPRTRSRSSSGARTASSSSTSSTSRASRSV